jgi:hypothetical protein
MANFAQEMKIAIKEFNVQEVTRILNEPGFTLQELGFSPYFFALEQRPQEDSDLVRIIECFFQVDTKKAPRIVNEPTDADVTFLHQVLSIQVSSVRLQLIQLLLRYDVFPSEKDFVRALELGLLDECKCMFEHGFCITIELRPNQDKALFEYLTLRTRISYFMDAIAKWDFYWAKATFFRFPFLNELADFFSNIKERYLALKTEERDLYLSFEDKTNVPRPCVNVLEVRKTKRKRPDDEDEDVSCEDRPHRIKELRLYVIPYYEIGIQNAQRACDNATRYKDSFGFFEARNSLRFFQEGKEDVEERLRIVSDRQAVHEQALLHTIADVVKKIPEPMDPVWDGVRDVLAFATQSIVSGKCSDFEQAAWSEVVRLVTLVNDGAGKEDVLSLQEALAKRFQVI